MRPSFSTSSLVPWTMRTPFLTCVSLGYPFRRLLVRSKKGAVFVCLILGIHGSLLVGCLMMVCVIPWSAGEGDRRRMRCHEMAGRQGAEGT